MGLMIADFRQFEAGPDLLGRTWRVEFLWIQNAIAIRRSDSVDVKFLLEREGERRVKVIALPHALLVELSQRAQRPLTDPWCARLAATCLKQIIETGEDDDRPLIVPRRELLEQTALGR